LSRNTDRRRHNAYSILALCGGAGLTAAELVDARIEDITTEGRHLFVNVNGTHPRRVPIWAPWHSTLHRAIDDRTSGHLFHGNRSEEYPPRLVQQFLDENIWELRPSPTRLRLTWVVRQIENDLPLSVLLAICGFTNASALNAYRRHLSPRAVSDFLGLITGEEVAR
jgi:integrase